MFVIGNNRALGVTCCSLLLTSCVATYVPPPAGDKTAKLIIPAKFILDKNPMSFSGTNVQVGTLDDRGCTNKLYSIDDLIESGKTDIEFNVPSDRHIIIRSYTNRNNFECEHTGAFKAEENRIYRMERPVAGIECHFKIHELGLEKKKSQVKVKNAKVIFFTNTSCLEE